MLTKLLATFAIFCSLAVLPALAQTTPPPIPGGTVLPGIGTELETADAVGKIAFVRETFITNLAQRFLKVIAATAVLMLVFGAYQYLTAVGNDEQIKQAHKTITWSLIGLVLALLAFAIVQIIVSIQFGDPTP